MHHPIPHHHTKTYSISPSPAFPSPSLLQPSLVSAADSLPPHTLSYAPFSALHHPTLTYPTPCYSSLLPTCTLPPFVLAAEWLCNSVANLQHPSLLDPCILPFPTSPSPPYSIRIPSPLTPAAESLVSASNFLKAVPLLSPLSEEQRGALANVMEQVKYSDGEYIVNMGAKVNTCERGGGEERRRAGM